MAKRDSEISKIFKSLSDLHSEIVVISEYENHPPEMIEWFKNVSNNYKKLSTLF